MKHCPDPSCPFLKRHGLPSEYRDDVSVCADCGGPLVEGAAPVPVSARGEQRAHAAPWSALAVTIAVLVAPLLAPEIPLPGVDQEELSGLAGTVMRPPSIGAFSLGVMPAISAFTLVELVALVIPGWRGLRHGGVTGRAKLLRATMVLTLLLALMQGWAQARSLESAGLLAATGLWPIARVTVTLAAGVFVWVAMAHLADRYALAGGYSLVLASGVLAEIADLAKTTFAKLSSGEAAAASLPLAVLGVGVMVAGTSWILVRRRAPGELRLPACGIAPISAAAALLMLPVTLANFGVRSLDGFSPHDTTPWLVAVALFAALYAYLFNLPSKVAAFAGKGIDVKRPLVRAVLFSAGVVVALVALGDFVGQQAGLRVGATSIFVGVAVTLDVLAQWRARRASGDLVPIWPEHRVYAVDAAIAGLARAGITAHARGVHHRVLLQFFGPFLPIVLCVPKDRADEATRILERILGSAPAQSGAPYRASAEG